MNRFRREGQAPSGRPQTEPPQLNRRALRKAAEILWLSESFIEDETMRQRLAAVELLEARLQDEAA